MTTIFVKSDKCKCEPGGQDKILALAEGHSTIWVCMHTRGYELMHKKVWEQK